MRNWFKTTIGFLAAFVIAGAFTSSVFGVASFARQTGLDCSSCHASAPGFPALNSFGAAFKAGGYVMGENMIGDDDRLSIPAALNLSVVTKIRAQYKGGDSNGGVTSFETQTPDEFAVFIAGRVGKNVGFVTEYGDGAPLSFKIPIVYDLGPAKLGITPWWSDAFSAAWIFETAATGAVRNIRATEARNVMSAFSNQGWGGAGGAAGLGFYVWHPMGFLAYTPFVQHWDGSLNASGAHYIRAAVTPTLGPLETHLGVAYYIGTVSTAATSCELDVETLVYGCNSIAPTDIDGLGVDLQLIGNVGIPLSAFITYFSDNIAATSDLAIYIEAGLVENVFNFGIGYNMRLDSNNSDLLFVLKYSLLANLRLSVDITYTLDDGLGNSGYEVMPMLFGSF